MGANYKFVGNYQILGDYLIRKNLKLFISEYKKRLMAFIVMLLKYFGDNETHIIIS
jgi:hypothetical protein